MSEFEDHQKGRNPVGNANRRHYRSQSFHEPGEYPPTMPLLAWTGSSAGQMPWTLKRSYTDNGRLVIHREVKHNHPQRFRAHRADGRLTLCLMHADESISSPRSASDNQTDAVESKDENEENDLYISKASLFHPLSSSSLAFREREKFKHIGLLPLGPDNQKTRKMEEREKPKEKITIAKRMELGLLKLPTSASSSSLSSLASSPEKNKVRKSLFNQGNRKKTPYVSRTLSLPSISSSMAELLGKGGNGIGFFADNRSNSNSPFQLPIQTIGSVRS
ncbi:uncharacterized protein LOC131244336 [Magnolia sinica]|uniref:uncharacterized protein LOC131244336 n=1 Tax=Magnolia sinica TaxID=86752 RepID=UPI002659900E|nr:uncharacterized protein LOC131244336 [Magnolia sinica]